MSHLDFEISNLLSLKTPLQAPIGVELIMQDLRILVMPINALVLKDNIGAAVIAIVHALLAGVQAQINALLVRLLQITSLMVSTVFNVIPPVRLVSELVLINVKLVLLAIFSCLGPMNAFKAALGHWSLLVAIA